MRTIQHFILGIGCTLLATMACADLSVPMVSLTKPTEGKVLGYIQISETQYGLLFTPHLHDLQPGLHGFHIHEHPSCGSHGMAAGGHLDPAKTNQHRGPYDDAGHLGDLPVLYVGEDGTAHTPVLAPRLRQLKDIQQHALMIHAGGDNYADVPNALGGGGERMECGVIQ